MKIKTIFLQPVLLAALLQVVLTASTAHAQTATPKSEAKPAVALTAEPYRSAFEGYQPYAEETIANWKSTNNTVEQIGGWREYARQSRQPANTPAQTNRTGEAAPKAKP